MPLSSTNAPAASQPAVKAEAGPLTAAQIQFYVNQGYLVLPDLIPPEELEELKRDTFKIARGGYPCPSLQPLPEDMSDAEAVRNILCIHQPHYISPVMRKYVAHPVISRVLGQIVGAHLAHWDGRVKCMQSMLFVKPPGFQGQAWHQDEVYIPTRDRSLTGAWIALDDATIANGCLWVIPGSHRTGYMYPQRKHERPEEWDFAPESHGFDESGKIPVEVKAGTVVFFNGYLLHCSLRNRTTDCYRRVLVNHYMNAWSLLPWGAHDAQRNQSAATADDRRVIPVWGEDPYAWKGYEQPGQDVWLRTCTANEAKK